MSLIICWTGVGFVLGFLVLFILTVEMLRLLRRNLYAADGSRLLDLNEDGAGVEPPCDLDETIARLRVFRDGDEFCFVLDDFINLQVSPAVFYHKNSHLVDELYDVALLLTCGVRMERP